MTKSYEERLKEENNLDWARQQHAAKQLQINRELAALQLATCSQERPETEEMEEYHVKGEDLCSMIRLYKATYSTKPDGTPHPLYKKPIQNEDGSATLYFASEQEFMNFSRNAAEQKLVFILTDLNQMVMGYSNGDGQLYHANGNECKKGDVLKPSNISLDEFMSNLRPTCTP